MMSQVLAAIFAMGMSLGSSISELPDTLRSYAPSASASQRAVTAPSDRPNRTPRAPEPRRDRENDDDDDDDDNDHDDEEADDDDDRHHNRAERGKGHGPKGKGPKGRGPRRGAGHPGRGPGGNGPPGLNKGCQH
jgi:hypothetical protein